ncbi:MAG: hypothetical protein LC126_14690 [Bryobacterales bacterium]|nr:hypothetical protein [Bryobacterales bacterium]
MKRSYHRHAFPAAGALFALAANLAWAQPGITIVEATETICAVTPGKTWVTNDGQTLHIRGQLHHNKVQSNEPRMNGDNAAIISVILNLVNGQGAATANFQLSPDGINGAWQGMGVFRIVNGKAVGIAVGHGTGDLEGQQIRLYLQEVEASVNPPPPCTPAGPSGNVQTRISGVIFNPRGK